MAKKIAAKRKLKWTRQLESLDCAPACLKMVAGYYGRNISLDFLRQVCKTNRLGTSLYSLTIGAKEIGLETVSATLKEDQLSPRLPFPAIALINKSHFVVVAAMNDTKNDKRIWRNSPKVFLVADPGFGKIWLTREEFSKKWADESGEGVIMFLDPTNDFYSGNSSEEPISLKNNTAYLHRIIQLVKTYKRGLLFILGGMLISSAISVSFPLLTQRVVDIGVTFQSTQFITLILVFQLCLFISSVIVDIMKSMILLHIGAKIEIGLTYDFLTKLMKLPLYFFDIKITADLMQRINDNSRIQGFIKSQLLDFLVAISTFITLSALMFHYEPGIFVLFFAGSALGIGWTLFFIKKRELLDYRRFDATTENMDNLIETIVAMPEIKLNNAQEIKKSKWLNFQVRLFDINTKIVSLQQYQVSGSSAIHQLKNIAVTFLAAQSVIAGQITIGEMLSLAIITGQLNVPLFQMVNFFQSLQDTRISFRRLAEIQNKTEEDQEWQTGDIQQEITTKGSIRISDLDFSYSGSTDDLVFEKLSLNIPLGKITALVGASGSGKTTLMKLLLKFYEPTDGSIRLNSLDLQEITSDAWRQRCGVVMQEGHIFNDTIENNITMSTEKPDRIRLEQACKISCIHSFVLSLPMRYSTKIGSGGMGLSTGQKQRILIARAVYKNPDLFFLDEATSALDANNEKEIQKNLESFFKGKTVFMIAHRLSTVINADHIVVLQSGRIIEQGSHETLIRRRDVYYGLIKNQLELGV